MNDSKDNRRQLLEDMQSSEIETLEQVRGVMKRVDAWLSKHPDDLEVLETAESLVMLESTLQIEL